MVAACSLRRRTFRAAVAPSAPLLPAPAAPLLLLALLSLILAQRTFSLRPEDDTDRASPAAGLGIETGRRSTMERALAPGNAGGNHAPTSSSSPGDLDVPAAPGLDGGSAVQNAASTSEEDGVPGEAVVSEPPPVHRAQPRRQLARRPQPVAAGRQLLPQFGLARQPAPSGAAARRPLANASAATPRGMPKRGASFRRAAGAALRRRMQREAARTKGLNGAAVQPPETLLDMLQRIRQVGAAALQAAVDREMANPSAANASRYPRAISPSKTVTRGRQRYVTREQKRRERPHSALPPKTARPVSRQPAADITDFLTELRKTLHSGRSLQTEYPRTRMNVSQLGKASPSPLRSVSTSQHRGDVHREQPRFRNLQSLVKSRFPFAGDRSAVPLDGTLGSKDKRADVMDRKQKFVSGLNSGSGQKQAGASAEGKNEISPGATRRANDASQVVGDRIHLAQGVNGEASHHMSKESPSTKKTKDGVPKLSKPSTDTTPGSAFQQGGADERKATDKLGKGEGNAAQDTASQQDVKDGLAAADGSNKEQRPPARSSPDAPRGSMRKQDRKDGLNGAEGTDSRQSLSPDVPSDSAFQEKPKDELKGASEPPPIPIGEVPTPENDEDPPELASEVAADAPGQAADHKSTNTKAGVKSDASKSAEQEDEMDGALSAGAADDVLGQGVNDDDNAGMAPGKQKDEAAVTPAPTPARPTPAPTPATASAAAAGDGAGNADADQPDTGKASKPEKSKDLDWSEPVEADSGESPESALPSPRKRSRREEREEKLRNRWKGNLGPFGSWNLSVLFDQIATSIDERVMVGVCPDQAPVRIPGVDMDFTYGVGCAYTKEDQDQPLCRCPGFPFYLCRTSVEPAFFEFLYTEPKGNFTDTFVENFGHCAAGPGLFISWALILVFVCVWGVLLRWADKPDWD
eukprot:TRINITY_DN16669_c0_g1_i1.p1 TRINITY_DN16669_c0_g1~~TRINITY_DN16669_c0_g1_i1.p1  ORF type:complete len:943 (-),score=169.39 TRINITY_DN16669_c0_g1_i1:185-2950(-)